MNHLKRVLLASLAAAPLFCAGTNEGIIPARPRHASETALPEKDSDAQNREPSFQGKGIDEFRFWTALHTLYPHDAYGAGTRGSVRVRFTVETDGTLSGIRNTDSPDQSFSEAVINR